MKTCSKGHGDFEGRKCPICQKEYLREYHQKNKDNVREVKKAWNEKNKEKMNVYHQEYRKSHKKSHNKYNRDWYIAHPLVLTYRNMLIRCLDPKSDAYSNYGGRGITVCDRWQGPDGFTNFESDMGPKPTPMHSIDRRKNNEGYSPENCWWATKKQQGANRRDNVILTINGQSLCVAEWARKYGIRIPTLWQRIKDGWEEDQLFSPPQKPYCRRNGIEK